MDGFKNTTKTRYFMGGSAKGNSVMGRPDMGRPDMGRPDMGRPDRAHMGKNSAPTAQPTSINPIGQAVPPGVSGSKAFSTPYPQAAAAAAQNVNTTALPALDRNTVKPPPGGWEAVGHGPMFYKKGGEAKVGTTPAPKKSAPVASRKPYVPSITEGAGDEALIAARKRGMSPGYKKGGMADLKQDKATVKKAVHKHEAAMHPGKPMTKLRKGGMPC